MLMAMRRFLLPNFDSPQWGRPALALIVMAAFFGPSAATAAAAADSIVPVFDQVSIGYDKTLKDGVEADGCRVYDYGCAVEKSVELPAAPKNQRDAQRIVATIIVEPVITQADGKVVPFDPWTRLGSLRLILPPDDAFDNPEAPSPSTATRPAASDASKAAKPKSKPGAGSGKAATPGTKPPPDRQLELVRFITPFGGPASYTQDVTSLVPFLQGKATLRLSLGTISKPAWKVTVTLQYTHDDAGYRRPAWADYVIQEDHVAADRNHFKVDVEVPPGLARPRLRIISTGHATDGTGGDEFVSRTHVLRIDGQEVARWRPWAEEGGSLRKANPMSDRWNIQGRELWSSDLDRSGWRPGEVVEPTMIPTPELAPGRRHTVEIEILNIRPKDQLGNHGYWRLSVAAVADEPWPEDEHHR